MNPRQERERQDFVFALQRAIQKHDLSRQQCEAARVDSHVTLVMNDLTRYPTIPGWEREEIYRQTFTAIREPEPQRVNKAGRRPVAA